MPMQTQSLTRATQVMQALPVLAAFTEATTVQALTAPATLRSITADLCARSDSGTAGDIARQQIAGRCVGRVSESASFTLEAPNVG
jgi:hypothetical protein